MPYTYRSPRSTRLTCPSIWQTAAAPSLSAAAVGRAEQIMRPPRREHASASMASPSASPRRGCHIGAWQSIEGGGVRSTCAVGCPTPGGPRGKENGGYCNTQYGGIGPRRADPSCVACVPSCIDTQSWLAVDQGHTSDIKAPRTRQHGGNLVRGRRGGPEAGEGGLLMLARAVCEEPLTGSSSMPFHGLK